MYRCRVKMLIQWSSCMNNQPIDNANPTDCLLTVQAFFINCGSCFRFAKVLQSLPTVLSIIKTSCFPCKTTTFSDQAAPKYQHQPLILWPPIIIRLNNCSSVFNSRNRRHPITLRLSPSEIIPNEPNSFGSPAAHRWNYRNLSTSQNTFNEVGQLSVSRKKAIKDFTSCPIISNLLDVNLWILLLF